MPEAESKSFQRFKGRYESLRQHSQIMAVALNKIFNYASREENNGNTLCEKLKISPDKYDKLDIPSSELSRIINFSRRENSDYCFTELYNLFSYYMKDVLREMYLLRPKSITSKSQKSLSFTDLSEFNSIDELINYMIDDIFKELEGIRSTHKLVKKIISHTKIMVPKNLSDDAMMYLNIRHLIIHNNSEIDKEFYNLYKSKLPISYPGKIPTGYSIFEAALTSVYNFIHHVDGALINNCFIKSRF